jgi:molybdopterin molybdotransferase
MDGWAVHGTGPWALVEHGQELARDQASPIVTGGLLPPGATAVLRSEIGQPAMPQEGVHLLTLGKGAKPGEPFLGQNIRKAGEEAAIGEILIPAGVVLNPAHVALAAASGRDELEVLGKPRVKVVLTGSEVVTSGIPAPGQVRDTFGPQFGTTISLLGAICNEQVRIGDSYTEWLGALKDAASSGGQPAHVVVTTGGTGQSDADHFRDAIHALGGHLLIDGIAMRPGHPAALAVLPDGRFALGLPGNPLAAMMALFTIGAPLFAALAHMSLTNIGEVPCGASIDPDPGRTRLIPVHLADGQAIPVNQSGPGMMRGLSSAHGVMIVPPEGVHHGGQARVFPLPWNLPGRGRWLAWDG